MDNLFIYGTMPSPEKKFAVAFNDKGYQFNIQSGKRIAAVTIPWEAVHRTIAMIYRQELKQKRGELLVDRLLAVVAEVDK